MRLVRGVWSVATLVLVALTLGGCASSSDRDVDRGRCERVRDHLVDVRLDGVVDDRAAHRAAAIAALGADFILRCVAETPRAELECALAVRTLDTLHSCTTAH